MTSEETMQRRVDQALSDRNEMMYALKAEQSRHNTTMEHLRREVDMGIAKIAEVDKLLFEIERLTQDLRVAHVELIRMRLKHRFVEHGMWSAIIAMIERALR